MIKVGRLEDRIQYRFKDKELADRAMRHSSHVNERRMKKWECNERLEFLGDAVLELLSSEFLYQEFPRDPEGDLTKLRASLVCEPTLARDARAFGLEEFLQLGKGEEGTGGRERDSIISDALEALIGALYLDGGLDAARHFVLKFVLNDIQEKKLFYDSKTVLQEMIQEERGEGPEYRLEGESGPDHAKVFSTSVYLGDRCLGRGQGKSKKASEQMAAYQAIRKLRGV